MKVYEEVGVTLHAFLISALNGEKPKEKYLMLPGNRTPTLRLPIYIYIYIGFDS
jgi:hypothetical protein